MGKWFPAKTAGYPVNRNKQKESQNRTLKETIYESFFLLKTILGRPDIPANPAFQESPYPS